MKFHLKLPGLLILLFLCVSCSGDSKARQNSTGIYSKTQLTYESEGVTISAELWLPEGPGPHPAIVTGHGSGRSKKESLSNMAEHFVQMGFAVLNHDKRGVGGSGGTYVQRYNASKENLNLLAKDISTGIDYLKQRPDIDHQQIGLWGVSQAGWILPIVATLQPQTKFMILISGPTVTVGEENTYSALTGDRTTDTGLTQEEISAKLRERGPYGFDPKPYLDELDLPSLWLLGEKDESIPIPETVTILDALKEQGKPYHYHIYPGANHGLRIGRERVASYWKDQEDFLREAVKVGFRNK